MEDTMISIVDIDDAIERRLEIFAAWGDCATWRNLANAAGLDPTSRKGYNLVVAAVNRIDRRRHALGLPLLSVLVHSTRSRRPRRGIARLLVDLRLIDDLTLAPEAIERQRELTWLHYAAKAVAGLKLIAA
jgi:hypothetical protein